MRFDLLPRNPVMINSISEYFQLPERNSAQNLKAKLDFHCHPGVTSLDLMGPSAKNQSSPHYPKPQQVGGTLIRRMIAFLRDQGLDLPITSHILCAVSGGSDSTALAHLLCHYGRRIVPRERITLVHINHGWRGTESDEDQRFVETLARRLKVPFLSFQLDTPSPESLQGRSWEEVAREKRKAILSRLAHERKALVFTAHHADDLAETVLWRILTGAAETHAGGIAVRYETEIRPLLIFRKSDLTQYLREEAQNWREDRTNHEGRFLRSRIRLEIMPVLHRVFPRAVEHLAELGLKAQRNPVAGKGFQSMENLSPWLGVLGIRTRRPHWESLRERLEQKWDWEGSLDLPGGWRLIRQVMPDAAFEKKGGARSVSNRNLAKKGKSTRKCSDLSEKSRDCGMARADGQCEIGIKERWILEKS